eukprot:130536-Chlamydomonas_euryale.AAC.4
MLQPMRQALGAMAGWQPGCTSVSMGGGGLVGLALAVQAPAGSGPRVAAIDVPAVLTHRVVRLPVVLAHRFVHCALILHGLRGRHRPLGARASPPDARSIPGTCFRLRPMSLPRLHSTRRGAAPLSSGAAQRPCTRAQLGPLPRAPCPAARLWLRTCCHHAQVPTRCCMAPIVAAGVLPARLGAASPAPLARGRPPRPTCRVPARVLTARAC